MCSEQQCRVCGCTDSNACLEGCEWIELDLCSNCFTAAQELRHWAETAIQPNWELLRREVVVLDPDIPNFDSPDLTGVQG